MKTLSWMLCLSLVGFGLVGCDDDEKKKVGPDPDMDGGPDASADAEPDAEPPTPTGSARLIHASPAAGNVDVYITGADAPLTAGQLPVKDNFALGQVLALNDVPAGDYDIHVFASDADPAEDDAILVIQDVTILANVLLTAAAVDDDVVQPADDDSLPDVLPLVELDDPETATNSMLSAVHAAPAFGTVDVWNADPLGELPLIDELEVGDQAPALELAPGTYTLGVDADEDPTPLEYEFTAPVAGGLKAWGIVVGVMGGSVTPRILLHVRGSESTSPINPNLPPV